MLNWLLGNLDASYYLCITLLYHINWTLTYLSEHLEPGYLEITLTTIHLSKGWVLNPPLQSETMLLIVLLFQLMEVN